MSFLKWVPKGLQRGSKWAPKRVSTCLHGKQVCDAVEVGKAGGAKQIEQGGAKQIEHTGGAKQIKQGVLN